MKHPICSHAWEAGRYVLPPLPYPVSSLEPFLDDETLTIHHDRHHAAYVAGANNAADMQRRIARGELSTEWSPAAARNLSFHLSGHILHCLYWSSMSSRQEEIPGGAIGAAINENLGCYEGFLRLFSSVAMGVQGNGWAILALDKVSRRLTVLGVHGHDQSMFPLFAPLVVCDLWEHAYYLHYRNNRAAYVNEFLNHINWEWVNKRMEACHE